MKVKILMVNPGDKLKCIQAAGDLKLNKVYTLQTVVKMYPPVAYRLCELPERTYKAERFKKV